MTASVLTGVIRTALGPGDMDREQRENYQVVIEAKDMAGQRGGLTGTTMVNITLTDVNDNPPRFTQSKIKAVRLYTKAETHTHIEFRGRRKQFNYQQKISLWCPTLVISYFKK